MACTQLTDLSYSILNQHNYLVWNKGPFQQKPKHWIAKRVKGSIEINTGSICCTVLFSDTTQSFQV